jgi:hypothetical protein
MQKGTTFVGLDVHKEALKPTAISSGGAIG